LTLSESGIPSVQTINWLYLSSHMRADALLTGCAVGLFATSGLLPRARWVTLLLGLGALLSTATLGYMIWSADMMSPLLYQGLFSAVAAMVALILIRLLSVPSLVARWILGSTPLVILGRLSYSLYLVHVPVLLWVPHGLLGFYHMKNVVMMTGAIFAAALVLYFLVERPFLLLKKYVEKRSGTRFKIPKNGPVNPQLAAA
jgi:peptidoglycan/LPS O-acetylase OafA/YrhL